MYLVKVFCENELFGWLRKFGVGDRDHADRFWNSEEAGRAIHEFAASRGQFRYAVESDKGVGIATQLLFKDYAPGDSKTPVVAFDPYG